MFQNLLHIKYISNILVYLSLLIIIFLLMFSIIKDNIAHIYYSGYKTGEERQNYKNQIHSLKRAVKLSPSNAETLFELGRFYVNEGRTGKSREDKNKSHKLAKEYFQKALMLKPTDGRYWAEYAWYSGHSMETKETIEGFTKAINLGMADAFVHSLYARWCVNQVKKGINVGNTIQIIEMYRKKQRLDSILQSDDSRFVEGVSIADLLGTAQVEWDKALSLGIRKNQTVYNGLADLNLLSCRFDKAIENYKRAKKKIMLTRCYFVKGEDRKAFQIVRSIVTGAGASSRRDLKEIKKLLMDVIKEEPEDYQSFYWLGEIYNRSRMIEKAIASFKMVVELNPEHIDAHLKLAKLYDLILNNDFAIEEYEIILRLNPKHKEAADLLSGAIRRKHKGSFLMTK